jgi:tetratricopeptide (TPR) repeat protein
LGGVALLSLILATHSSSPTAWAQSSENSLLEVGKTVQRELAPSQKHDYRIEIPANHFLNIKIEQQGLDVALNLFAPGGEKVFELDSPNGRDGPEDLRVAVSVPGIYVLEVCAEEKGAPAGRYVATLVELRAATPADFKDSLATMDFNEGLRLQKLRTATALHQALSKLGEAEQLRVELRDKPGQIEVIKYKAITYQIMGDQKSAIETYQRGIPLAKETSDVKNQGVIYNNLGFIYFKLDDYQNALFYMRLGLETLIGGDQEKKSAEPLINIAAT